MSILSSGSDIETAETKIRETERILDDILSEEKQISEVFKTSQGKKRARAEVKITGDLEDIITNLDMKVGIIQEDLKQGAHGRAKEESDNVNRELQRLEEVLKEIVQAAETVYQAISMLSRVEPGRERKENLEKAAELAVVIGNTLDSTIEDIGRLEKDMIELDEEEGEDIIPENLLEILDTERERCEDELAQLRKALKALPDEVRKKATA